VPDFSGDLLTATVIGTLEGPGDFTGRVLLCNEFVAGLAGIVSAGSQAPQTVTTHVGFAFGDYDLRH
jgi:hypothetical protein